MDEKTPYEQMVEGANQLALLVKTYYDALIGMGFTVDGALRLASEYQRDVFTKAMLDSKDKNKSKKL